MASGVPNAAAPIGVSNLTIWPLTSDAFGGSPTWGSPISLPGAAEANRDPAASQTPYYADNFLYAVGTTKGFQKIQMKLFYVDPQTLAQIVGETYALGQSLGQANDTPPYFAVAYKILMNDGTFVYRVLYKCQFMKNKTDNKTKAASISFVEVNLDGTVAALTSLGYDALEQWGDDTNGSATAITNWFTTPQLPGADNTALTVVATQGGSNTTSKVVLTFAKASGASFRINFPTITATSCRIEKAGVATAGTFVDTTAAAGTTQVVTFTPTVAWATAQLIQVNVDSTAKDTNQVGCTYYTTQLTLA